LSAWPRLSTIPTTNAMLALVMLLWLLTGCCALLFALVEHLIHAHAAGAVALAVPDRWYGALEVFTGIVVVQFIGKRGTDSTLWRGESPTGDSQTSQTTTTTTKSRSGKEDVSASS
jgi:hypothetical protein